MKTVLITGISRGIGKALAQKFLRSGYFVIGTSTSGKCDLADLNLVVFQLDLKKKESIDACVEEIHNLDKKNRYPHQQRRRMDRSRYRTRYKHRSLATNLGSESDRPDRFHSKDSQPNK